MEDRGRKRKEDGEEGLRRREGRRGREEKVEGKGKGMKRRRR